MAIQAYGIEALWQQSDIVIKTVACILLIMSICTWIIILVRSWQLTRLNRLSKKVAIFWQAKNFEAGLPLLDSKHVENPFYDIAFNGKTSVDHHLSHKNDLHALLPLTDWLTTCLDNTIDEFNEKLQFGLGVMASVGSTSPFIGLFGTVWGIYHALIGISAAGHVNISEVAGPIGESLIMTAFGLVVAIPAVLGFNAINRGNKKFTKKLYRFAHQIHAYFLTDAVPPNSQFMSITLNKQDI